MNNKVFSYMTIAALMAGMSSCSMEQPFSVGEGTMYISTRINSDVVVETRSETEAELAASTKVWIYSDEGVIRKYDGKDEVPAEGLKLIAGNYTVKAWAGTLSYASFEDRWFEGEEEVTIESDKNTSVEVECKIANVVASVNYAEDIEEYISDYSMDIFHKGGSLTYDVNNPELKGYFIMPDDVTDLSYSLTFKTDGQEKTVTGTIEDVEPAHQYILNVKANKQEMEGAAFITITVDDTMTDYDDEITISTPPAITGYGFDLSSPVAGESGTIGRKSIYVAATSAVSSLQLTNLPGLGDITEIDFINATESYISDLENAGIFHQVTTLENGSQLVKVVFDEKYINSLPNSDDPYIINIKATDSAEPNHKTVTATLTLRISEAPVVLTEIPAESQECYYEQTLTATIAKDGVEIAGFEYAKVGETTWEYKEATQTRAGYTKGASYSVTLTDLELGTSYKYRAASGTEAEGITYRSDESTFSTGTLNQLPNASFENWYTASDSALVPAEESEESWDCGNHGSVTMNVQLTQSFTDFFHSGTQCAKLRSQFVGLGIIGKFAAGNLFYGKYIGTDGTDGIIGFGRAFTFPKREIKPTAIKMWVKYETAAANSKGAGDYVEEGDNDTGHIFIALFDAPYQKDSSSSNNGKYGFVVRTKNQSQLFDKTEDNVIAYGEKIFTENTEGDGLIEITIPFEYYAGKENNVPTHIAVVCTASKYGDYFEGGEGSTMYVDDVEIVYGKK